MVRWNWIDLAEQGMYVYIQIDYIRISMHILSFWNTEY